MKTKQEQIEKMMLDVPQTIVAYDANPRGQHLYGEQRLQIAEILYDKGYGDISEYKAEIERLKAENDTNMQYIRMMGIQSHIKTSNEQVKQAQIDILNKAKEKLDSAPNGWAYTGYIDDLIEEVEK